MGSTNKPKSGNSSRAFCHTRHTCHHWFEDECSAACDRGEHDHSIGAAECTDPQSGGSHSCETCESCGCGGAKCCGCYDGVCCRETGGSES